MSKERLTVGSGIALLIAFLVLLGAAAVFAFVPLVECHRCNQQGQYTYETPGRRPGMDIDFCDCGTFLIPSSEGKRAKISLLRSLMKPRPLKIED